MNKIQDNSVTYQQQIILEWLRIKPLTTYQGRNELDVVHVAGRIKELREQGHNIITYIEDADNGQSKHRVAKYVLLPGGEHE